MGITRKKAKSRSDYPGGFGGLPKIVWTNPSYSNLSGNAVKLLMDFACQYNGHNNGDLTNAYSVLKTRGWRSKDTIRRATLELIDAGLIIQTRQGRFTNPGGVCSLFALTWQSIDECPKKHLERGPTTTPVRKFSLEINVEPRPISGMGRDPNMVRSRARDEHGRYSSD